LEKTPSTQTPFDKPPFESQLCKTKPIFFPNSINKTTSAPTLAHKTTTKRKQKKAKGQLNETKPNESKKKRKDTLTGGTERK
jgi:hypothetical protein